MLRGQWRPKLTSAELTRGWVFFILYLFAFPFLMSWVQRSMGGEWPLAEANVVYYLFSVTLVVLLLWGFFRKEFSVLLDWLPENLFGIATGLVGTLALHFLVMLIPYPVRNPNEAGYAQEYFLSPAATVVVLVVLMPIVEEALFRGLLFGALRSYSRILAYIVTVTAYCLFCVWQFVFTYGGVDFRYLLLTVQYLPMSLALTWCYDAGGSIWSPIFLHAAINAFTLAGAVR